MAFFNNIGQFFGEQVAPALHGAMVHVAVNAGPAAHALARNAHGVAVNNVAPAAHALARNAHGVAVNNIAPAAHALARNAHGVAANNVAPAALALSNNAQLIMVGPVSEFVCDVIHREFGQFSKDVIRGAMQALDTVIMQMRLALETVHEVTTLIAQKAAELLKAMEAINAKDVKEWAMNHRLLLSSLTIAIGSIIILTTPAGTGLAMAGINAAGFGAAGVTAASLAAAIQSHIGNVAAGSLFSTLQSAAAGGAGMVVVETIVAIAGSMGLATGLSGTVLGIAKDGVEFEGLDSCKDHVDGQKPEHYKM